jgi:hypothetical protein
VLVQQYSESAFITPGESGISTVAVTAEVLFAFDVPDNRMAMLNAAMLFNTDADTFAAAAEVLFLEFAATLYARENPGELAHTELQSATRPSQTA